MNSFVTFMNSLDLSTNVGKSQVMVIGPKFTKTSVCSINGVPMRKVSSFPYLGIPFDAQVNWGPLVKQKDGLLIRSTQTLFDFAKRLGHSPAETMVKIFRAKCLSMALYGAELWGYVNAGPLQIKENNFCKRLLGLPEGVTTFGVHEELELT